MMNKLEKSGNRLSVSDPRGSLSEPEALWSRRLTRWVIGPIREASPPLETLQALTGQASNGINNQVQPKADPPLAETGKLANRLTGAKRRSRPLSPRFVGTGKPTASVLIYILMLSALICALTSPASGAEGVCVTVKLEIVQEVTMEREAFDARLALTNKWNTEDLTNLKVVVELKDADGFPANDLFFMKVKNMENIEAIDGTGTISPGEKAIINWLIIPEADAGGIHPGGKRYSAKATIYYAVRGTSFDFQTWPDWITVKPQPMLRLDYMLPRIVYGDDPFTDVVEPARPFNLALKVTNIGYGVARNLKIDSAQPRIVDNFQNLLIDFKILGSWLNGIPASKSLKLEFGDLEPGDCVIGAWEMICTISGEFTEFEASFTHSAELGGEATSLIESVNTYFLEKEIMVDLPGSDTLRDFLIDINDDEVPDTIFQSNCQETPVNPVSSQTLGIPTAQDPTVKVVLDYAFAGWIYTAADDPMKNQYQIVEVVRSSDGKVLDEHNYWLKGMPSWSPTPQEDTIRFVDYDALGMEEYTVTYQLDVTPPETTISVGLPQFGEEPIYVSPSTEFTLSAIDGGITPSGVALTQYKVDTGDWITYESPFSISTRGAYTLYYQSIDNIGNVELPPQSLSLIVDTTPPVVTMSIGEPKEGEDPVYVTPDTEFSLSATDTLTCSDGPLALGFSYHEASGLWYKNTGMGPWATDWSTDCDHPLSDEEREALGQGITCPGEGWLTRDHDSDPANWARFWYWGYLPGEEVWFYYETIKDKREEHDRWVIFNPDARADNASGVAAIQYRMDEGDWVSYTTPFTILDQGPHTIHCRSSDNVGNETEASLNIQVEPPFDITPPSISAVSISVVDNLGRDNIFSPGTASLEETVNINFASDEIGTYEVIIDTDGAAGFNSATDKTYSGLAIIGLQSIVWDGRDVSGDIVPDGTYYIRIIVTDEAGNPTLTLQKYVNE